MAFTLTAISSFAFPPSFFLQWPDYLREAGAVRVGKEMVTNHPSSLSFLALFSPATPPVQS
jgi:hypothetical protein